MSQTQAPSAPAGGRFNWFSGVFTPSILTVLGVVMYLLLGWTTGQAGLGMMLVIVFITHLITGATALSVSSIATNRTVGTGGAYFMISRSLGPSVGSAVGIPLFLAQALSVTFYVVGFAEAMHLLIPGVPIVVIGTITNLVVLALAYWNASIAIRAQYFVMAAIGLSLLSFFTGTTGEFPRTIEWINRDGASFIRVFSVFFPAATGIMAGVSLSGDLRNPRRDIPKGIMLVVAASLIVYVAFPIWFSLNFSNEDLINNLDAVFLVSSVPALIYLGVFGASLSSALGSILSAPRTLQALANDGHVPRFFGRGYGKDNEPRVGTMLTFVLAQIGVMTGSLEAIAPVLTMFFLATYGALNLASGLETWAANPSFRPTFRVPAPISLLAALACFYVMSIINLPAMLVSSLILIGLFAFTQRRALDSAFGDARHGLWSALVLAGLRNVHMSKEHPINWRPNLVVMGGDIGERQHLLDTSSALVQSRGLVTFVHLLEGSVAERADERKVLNELYKTQLAETYPNVFYRAEVVGDIYLGAVTAAQTYGIGNFQANAVMLGWPKSDEQIAGYLRMLRDLHLLERTILLVRDRPGSAPGTRGGSIHVWWTGATANGSLMLLLAHLVTQHNQWRRSRITVLTAVENPEDVDDATEKIRKLLEAARIDADINVILTAGRPLYQVFADESGPADLVFLGFLLPTDIRQADGFYRRMSRIMSGLPRTILVSSARSHDFESVVFDTAEMDVPVAGKDESA
ncbi:MAG: Na-K-Cl cotransporter [Acidimicrobiia bacterium]|nr:Na-K-Cl cotransporter [Acidimicrobiia bacterium]